LDGTLPSLPFAVGEETGNFAHVANEENLEESEASNSTFSLVPLEGRLDSINLVPTSSVSISKGIANGTFDILLFESTFAGDLSNPAASAKNTPYSNMK
jgi:hypothetical protein